MANLFVNEQLPTTSEEAIRIFDEKYLAVLSAAPPSTWADRFIESISAPRVTYPMAFMSTKFLETKEGSGRFRGMGERSVDLKVSEFDAGYEAKLLDLQTNVFAYRKWTEVPGRFRLAESRHYASQLASLFEAGSSTACGYDGANFFSASHLSNPLFAASGTWSNLQSSATDVNNLANIQTEMTAMRLAVKDENGDKLLVEPDELWLPTEKFQAVSDKLNQAFLASGESNYMAGKLKVVHVPELTDVNDWYLVDSKLLGQGFNPMIAAKFQPSDSLGLRSWDESSDFFKETGKIKVSQHIWSGYALLYPHAIRKIVGA